MKNFIRTIPSNLRKVISILLVSTCMAMLSSNDTAAALKHESKLEPIYSYTIYGDVELEMGVNVESYIVEDGDTKWFQVAQLAYDCGWLGDESFSVVDRAVEASYTPGMFAYDGGNVTAWLMLDGYHDETVPGGSDSQLCSAQLTYYREDGLSDLAHSSLFACFERHFSEDDYRIVGYDWYVSYDDMVMLSYIFWAEAAHPGENPLVSEFGTDYAGAEYCDDYVTFCLP